MSSQFVFCVILKSSSNFHWSVLSDQQQWHNFPMASNFFTLVFHNLWCDESSTAYYTNVCLVFILFSHFICTVFLLRIGALSIIFCDQHLIFLFHHYSSMSLTSWRRVCIRITTATVMSLRSSSRTTWMSRQVMPLSRGQFQVRLFYTTLKSHRSEDDKWSYVVYPGVHQFCSPSDLWKKVNLSHYSHTQNKMICLWIFLKEVLKWYEVMH